MWHGPEAEKKKVKRTTSTWGTWKGTTPVLHPIEQSHTCLLFDLEHDERVVLQRGRAPPTAQVAPLGEPLLVAIREKRCGHKERAEVQEDASLAQNVGSGLQKRDVGYVRNAEHALHGYATRVIRVPEAHLEANA